MKEYADVRLDEHRPGSDCGVDYTQVYVYCFHCVIADTFLLSGFSVSFYYSVSLKIYPCLINLPDFMHE